MPPSKLSKERPNQNIAASNPNPVFNNNLEILSNSTQKVKQNTKQNNKVPIKLFYRNQMTSYSQREEKELEQINHNNIKISISDVHVKLRIYYKKKKLKNLLISNNNHKYEEHDVVYLNRSRVTMINFTYDSLRPQLSHVWLHMPNKVPLKNT